MPENRPPETYWYIEPLDAQTNKVLASELDPETSIMRDAETDDGRRHNIYRVPDWLKLSTFLKSRGQLGLKFLVFTQQGTGKIRRAPGFLVNQRPSARKRPRTNPKQHTTHPF